MTKPQNSTPELFRRHHIRAYLVISANLESIPSEINLIERSGELAVVNTPPGLKEVTPASTVGVIASAGQASLAELYTYDSVDFLGIQIDGLDTLPAGIGQLTQLTSLGIYNSKLTSLPAELWQLTHLTYFNLHDSRLTSLPVELGQLTHLTSLNLSYNQFTSLPAELWQFTHLTSLNLSFSKLASLPTELGNLTQLTSLDLHGNQLTNLPAGIGQLTQLTSLDLHDNKLATLPAELWQLTHLTSLDLHDNKLASLPAELWQFTHLISLNLSFCKLASLPTELGNLTQLTSLDLHGNQLTSLPAGIGQLTQLTSLDLHDNKLATLPAELGQLTHLTSLILGGNQLTSLPAELWQLIQLTSLNLSRNKLTSLPAEIGQLTKLTSLDLSSRDYYRGSPSPGNQIQKLPHQLLNLTSLKILNLQDNPLDFPPEILEKTDDPQAILAYFRWVVEGKKKAIAETKLLVVGQGSVGKTSLIKRLTAGTYDPNETKTDGIEINRWQVPNLSQGQNQPTAIALNIWDFGGQEIMHATHQFFLSKRSLYLLVLDSRLSQEANRVEYWLKIIQSFGGDAPVLIVGNKVDQNPLDIDRIGLQKKYPNIRGIFETSAAVGTGIQALLDAITRQVNALPHIRDMLPETWFTIKTSLEAMGLASNFITQDQYLELCVAHEISAETDQRTLIGFLHDLGVILHFQDDPRLEALGILNPQWVTNGVYKIVNSRALFDQKGVLTTPMLDNILDLPDYPHGKRLYIADMMKRFELCYLMAENTFLVPDLLPTGIPAGLPFSGIPAFEYRYPVLPSSIITRFIVRMNLNILDGYAWREGVLLQLGQSTALVNADYEERKITIATGGLEHTRRDALSAIRYQLDEIHRSFKELNPKKLVPVPGAVQAEPMDYETLLMLERAGQETLMVRDGDHLIEVNIREVLSGIENNPRSKESGGNVTIINNYGNNASIILNSKIQSSFNQAQSADIQPELKEALKQLAAAVDAMNKALSEEQAAEAADDLTKLVDEATKTTPNKKWYSVSIEGLIKAAENLDKLGEPVIRLSRRVLSLLTAGLIKD